MQTLIRNSRTVIPKQVQTLIRNSRTVISKPGTPIIVMVYVKNRRGEKNYSILDATAIIEGSHME